ncbi:MAG: hypothetical protein ACOH2F_19605 [Cellulomonas sp.]
MTRPARAAAVFALATPIALALAACSSSGSSSSDASTQSSAEANRTWANSVCTSLAAVKTDLDSINLDLTLDPQAGTALEQLKTQLSAATLKVRGSVDDLATAIAAAPVDPGAQDLKTNLDAASNDVSDAAQAAADAAEQAANATSVAGFLAASGTALSEVAAATTAAGTFATTLGDSANQASDNLAQAFSTAPACGSVRTPPS